MVDQRLYKIMEILKKRIMQKEKNKVNILKEVDEDNKIKISQAINEENN